MNPAEELCAAATRLRCDHTFHIPRDQPRERPVCPDCGTPWGRHEAVAADVAEPLANLLDDQAKAYELFLERHMADVAERVVWHALGVARAITGGAR